MNWGGGRERQKIYRQDAKNAKIEKGIFYFDFLGGLGVLAVSLCFPTTQMSRSISKPSKILFTSSRSSLLIQVSRR